MHNGNAQLELVGYADEVALATVASGGKQKNVATAAAAIAAVAAVVAWQIACSTFQLRVAHTTIGVNLPGL